MNIQLNDTTVTPPPAPKRMEDMQLPIVMMRDILIKTMFRKNVTLVSEVAEAIAFPSPSHKN